MKAIRKEPGCAPELIDIDNTLKALQTEVGGYIETVTIASDAVVICNEEGVLLGMPYNCRFSAWISSVRSSWSAATRTSSVTCRRPTS